MDTLQLQELTAGLFHRSTEVLVECWGAGGAGRGFASATQARTGAGGAGGAYAASIVSVTPGAIIPYSIGDGGTGTTGNGTAGGDTSWNSGQYWLKVVLVRYLRMVLTRKVDKLQLAWEILNTQEAMVVGRGQVIGFIDW